MGTVINVDDIVQQFGNYYRNEGQSTGDLYQVARQSFVSNRVFSLRITRDTLWKAAKTQVGSLVQPFQVAFTPRTQSLTFEPLEIRQHHMKVDDGFFPDDLMPSWAGFLASTDVDRSKWPFIRWFMEQHVAPQIAQDIELNEIGIGVATAPTPNTAGPIKTSMDGIQTIINTQINNGRIEPITMGSIPNNNEDFVYYIEDFADHINKLYWRKDMTIYLNESLHRKYLRGHAKIYGKETNSTVGKGGTNKVEFTNLSVEGLPSMNFKNNGEACNRIFCTPRENAIMMQDRANPFENFELQKDKRQVITLSDWWMGVGFILPEIVFTNDQE